MVAKAARLPESIILHNILVPGHDSPISVRIGVPEKHNPQNVFQQILAHPKLVISPTIH